MYLGNRTWRRAVVVSLFCLVGAAGGRTIYVDADAVGANDGSSWADAYKYLQDALANAELANKPVEVRIARGVYTPDRGAANAPGDRKASFGLVNGVTIRGGYAGFGEPNPDAWDFNLYKTVLSGDVKGDDASGFVNNADNSYHVVTGSDVDSTAVIGALTVSCGNANGNPPDHCGGGIKLENGSPILTNCTLMDNSADGVGGAIHNSYGSPILTGCLFVGNAADGGAGMENEFDSVPILVNCRFIGNSAPTYGGAILNHGFPEHGTYVCQPTLVNCTFSGNSSGGIGGAVCSAWSHLMLANCTFASNTSDEGGAVYGADSITTFANCILWANIAGTGPQIALANQSVINVSFCCLQGGYGQLHDDGTCSIDWGFGNIDVDPNFQDMEGPDGVAGTSDDILRLTWGSLCIDAGDNYAVPADLADVDCDGNTVELTGLDLGGGVRFRDEPSVADTGNGPAPVVDLGAFEYRPGVCADAAHPYPTGDLNQDCKVDLLDVSVLADNWLAGI